MEMGEIEAIWYKGVQGSRRGFGSPYCGNNSKGKGMIRCHFSCLTPVRLSLLQICILLLLVIVDLFCLLWRRIDGGAIQSHDDIYLDVSKIVFLLFFLKYSKCKGISRELKHLAP